MSGGPQQQQLQLDAVTIATDIANIIVKVLVYVHYFFKYK